MGWRAAPQANRTYVGATACADCHINVYQRWAKTRMANVVTDPRVQPQVVVPDFSKPDPLLTFKLDDVAFVYGTKWKQRYFKKVGNDYFPLPAQWDVNHKIWRAYFVQPNTDWWVPFYPRSEEHTSELQSHHDLVCRLLLEKKKKKN